MSTANVTTREIEPSVDHNHCTTRQFQHMVFRHEGTWTVFYSDGRDLVCQTSTDGGVTWRRAEEPVAPAPNGSTSHDVLKTGDAVYMSYVHYPLGRYDIKAPYRTDPARRHEYTSEGRIKEGRIEGTSIRWLRETNPGFTPDYGNLVRDTLGHLWVFTREPRRGLAYRSRRPDDISDWSPAMVCIPDEGRHAMNAAALDSGKLYAASVLTTSGRMMGNLYDGERWGTEAVLLSDRMTSVAGDDRRLALEFDPAANRLHLVYIDRESILRYRCLRAPYGSAAWEPGLAEPGCELASGVFTCALSVDSSRKPYGLAITYGVQKHGGRDKRERTGPLYVRRFDGTDWMGDPVLVSHPGTVHNWYPNVNQDAKDGICVMYSRSVDPKRLGKPLAVMVSVVRAE